MTLTEWFEPISLIPVEDDWVLDVFVDVASDGTIEAYSQVNEWVDNGANVGKFISDNNAAEWIGSYTCGDCDGLMYMLRQELLDREIDTCWIVSSNHITVLLDNGNTEGEDDNDTDS